MGLGIVWRGSEGSGSMRVGTMQHYLALCITVHVGETGSGSASAQTEAEGGAVLELCVALLQ